MNTQNNKTKLTILLTSLMMGLVLVSPTTVIPNVSATPLSHHIGYSPPTLSPSMNQAIIKTALAIPELQNWSHDWKYVHMAFLGNNKAGTPDFKWQYAIVDLKTPSSSAPVACDDDWWAWVEIDMTTMKVVSSTYPSMDAHVCHGAKGSGVGNNSTYSMAEQKDVHTTTYYGNYAELNLPSFSNSIYTDLHGAYVEQFVNAQFPYGPSNGCSVSHGCIEQAGWLLTTITSTCTGCNISANTNDIVYVDESVHHIQSDYNTGLKWTGSTTTLYGETDCAYTVPDYAITISNGTNTFTENTNILCSTPQNQNDYFNNSVFFEDSANETSSTWSGDITGTVSATNALEFTGTSTTTTWSNSAIQDTNCHRQTSSSQVITGDLLGGDTATWSSLNKQPAAC